MARSRGWVSDVMLGAYKKEASYGAGVTMNDTNAFSFNEFDFTPEWPDELMSNKEAHTGTEHGNDQELTEKRFKGSLTLPQARPNDIAALAALILGDITSAQDGATGAYKHSIVPVAVGTDLVSGHLEYKQGGVQYKELGIKGNMLKLMGSEGGYLGLEAELIGRGDHTPSATAFAAKVSESRLPVNLASVWLESGADISISAVGSAVQGSEDISSATPEAIKARVKSFEFTFNNNLVQVPGFGGAGLLQDADYARRAIELKCTLEFVDASSTEINYYLNQTALALEFDFKGALIAGTTYHGMQLIIPRFMLKAPPLPKGGIGDILTLDLEGDVQDDGTNDACIIETYNQVSAYWAA